MMHICEGGNLNLVQGRVKSVYPPTWMKISGAVWKWPRGIGGLAGIAGMMTWGPMEAWFLRALRKPCNIFGIISSFIIS
jgi:hypothetical protein